MKKTKIVATIGPVTTSQEMFEKLLKAGLNVARFNFSHGDFAEHQEKVDNARKASEKLGMPITLFQDLGGPKIRLGDFGTENGRVTIKKGQTFTMTTEKITGDENRCHVNYAKLTDEIKVGETVMVDDGKKRMVVTKVEGTEIVCKVIVGGELKGRRGINLPDTDLTISSLTAKDKKDLEFGIKNEVDYVALSFVRRPSDVEELRAILNKRKSFAGIISKIETPQAIENIDRIIELSDAIMVARGDLAVEVPAEEVPLLQKMIIDKCNRAGKMVITATQMLESMIKSPVPTRAEVSDVANAILDGTDAIMLSEETTLGDYPIEAVELMTKVANRVENDMLHERLHRSSDRIVPATEGEAVAAAAVRLAKQIGAKFLISLTNYGSSARLMARHRPQEAILVFTPNADTVGKLGLAYGCQPHEFVVHKEIAHAIDDLKKVCVAKKYVKKGDSVVIVSALPFGKKSEANSVTVETF